MSTRSLRASRVAVGLLLGFPALVALPGAIQVGSGSRLAVDAGVLVTYTLPGPDVGESPAPAERDASVQSAPQRENLDLPGPATELEPAVAAPETPAASEQPAPDPTEPAEGSASGADAEPPRETVQESIPPEPAPAVEEVETGGGGDGAEPVAHRHTDG